MKKKYLFSKIYPVLVFAFLYAPIAVLILFSFNSGKSTAVFEGFSLRWYEEIFKDTATLEAFKNTVIVAVVSALVSTVMGTAAAIAINNYKLKWFKQATLTTTNIPMMNPDIVKGLENGTISPEQAATSYDYTYPLVMLATLGAVALVLGLILKVIDKKKGLGIETPNVQ